MSNVAVASDSLQMSQQARSRLAAEGVAGRFRESKGGRRVCGMGTARVYNLGILSRPLHRRPSQSEQMRYIGLLH